MAKSIKFNNNIYLDSSSIVHNMNKLSSILTYSTQERIIATWDDGKPLYEKTIINNSGSVPTEISISNINANYVFVEKMIIDYIAANDSRYIRHEFNLGGSEYFLSFIRGDTIQIRNTITNIKRINSVKLIIRYTKTSN